HTLVSRFFAWRPNLLQNQLQVNLWATPIRRFFVLKSTRKRLTTTNNDDQTHTMIGTVPALTRSSSKRYPTTQGSGLGNEHETTWNHQFVAGGRAGEWPGHQ